MLTRSRLSGERATAVAVAVAAIAMVGVVGCARDDKGETGARAGEGAPGCSQGDTRECVGPGACEGGQTCGDDGKWEACDCGDEEGGPSEPSRRDRVDSDELSRDSGRVPGVTSSPTEMRVDSGASDPDSDDPDETGGASKEALPDALATMGETDARKDGQQDSGSGSPARDAGVGASLLGPGYVLTDALVSPPWTDGNLSTELVVRDDLGMPSTLYATQPIGRPHSWKGDTPLARLYEKPGKYCAVGEARNYSGYDMLRGLIIKIADATTDPSSSVVHWVPAEYHVVNVQFEPSGAPDSGAVVIAEGAERARRRERSCHDGLNLLTFGRDGVHERTETNVELMDEPMTYMRLAHDYPTVGPASYDFRVENMRSVNEI